MACEIWRDESWARNGQLRLKMAPLNVKAVRNAACVFQIRVRIVPRHSFRDPVCYQLASNSRYSQRLLGWSHSARASTHKRCNRHLYAMRNNKINQTCGLYCVPVQVQNKGMHYLLPLCKRTQRFSVLWLQRSALQTCKGVEKHCKLSVYQAVQIACTGSNPVWPKQISLFFYLKLMLGKHVLTAFS